MYSQKGSRYSNEVFMVCKMFSLVVFKFIVCSLYMSYDAMLLQNDPINFNFFPWIRRQEIFRNVKKISKIDLKKLRNQKVQKLFGKIWQIEIFFLYLFY